MEKNHICKKCGGVAGWDSYFQSWICTRCGNEEPKPITNADRIRSYTDQELAKFLGFVAQDAFCYGSGLRDKMVLFPFWEYDSTIEWLRREAENEESI